MLKLMIVCIFGCFADDFVVGYRAPTWWISTSVEKITRDNPEVTSGGKWTPTACSSRYRIAIIVPYRNRASQLLPFLSHMHPFLQRQRLAYRIFLVQQTSPQLFNQAMLLNIGYVEAKKMGNFDCFIFHDVDMLPEDDRNIYICGNKPRHVGFLVQKFAYRLLYDNVFGGSTAFTPEQFESVNGFSNTYYGWGGEDDDIYRRVHGIYNGSIRFPRSVARYTMIPHRRDNPVSQENAEAIEFRPAQFREDGLNTLNYTLHRINLQPLYTLIDVTLPDPPGDVSGRREKT